MLNNAVAVVCMLVCSAQAFITAQSVTVPYWETSAYVQVSAHQPAFDNTAFWPKLTGKEAYKIETWPAAARLLVWAHPGKSGGAPGPRSRDLDVTDPKSWLENGKTPERVVLNEQTDLLFPASDTPYTVGFRGTPIGECFRHLTVERNAAFRGGGDGVGRVIYGNVWVKRGGRMYSQGATRFVGNKHVFFRNDNDESMNTSGESYIMLSQYFVFNKEKTASVEVLGHVTMLDEFNIAGCTLILGPDSKLQPGRNANPIIQGGGTLVLLDGAYFGLWANNLDTRDLEVTGAIQGGLPERPLTRNATVGLNFKNWTKAPFPTDDPVFAQKIASDEKIRSFIETRVPALILHPGSVLRSYATDLDNARLVFTWNGNTYSKFRPIPDAEKDKAAAGKSAFTGALYRWFDAIPPAVDIYFSTDTMVDGVEFDTFHAGGLILADPALRQGWKNLYFGSHNLVKDPPKLFVQVERIGRNGSY